MEQGSANHGLRPNIAMACFYQYIDPGGRNSFTVLKTVKNIKKNTQQRPYTAHK